MTRSKRPWKKGKWGAIDRVELNNGDVQFIAKSEGRHLGYGAVAYGTETPFESLTEAETHLDVLWADWWPKQVKRTRSA